MERQASQRDPGAGELDELAINTIRFLSVDGIEKAASGHPGAPMGLAPLGYMLFTRVLKHNPLDPRWLNRDRFVLSAGHASMLLYSLLHLCGYDVTLEDLKRFRQWGSRTPGHPEFGHTPGVETTTGPLGQGFGNAVGMALGERMLAGRFNRDEHEIIDYRTYCICSDGDMQEGVASEAASLAGHWRLGKLTMLYDNNHIQLSGPTKIAMSEDVEQRFRAYGWHTINLKDPVRVEEIPSALEEARAVEDRPSLILLRTHIGFGSPDEQDTAACHGSPLGPEETKLTKENLGWPLEPTFFIPDAVREIFEECKTRGARIQREWEDRFARWAGEYPHLASEIVRRADSEPASALVDVEPLVFDPQDGPVATRTACGKALNHVAPCAPELVGGSADLDPSTQTYLTGAGDVQAASYDARNIHFGVREHAMGAIVNGVVLSGFRAFGATFFNFLDYMRGSVRLSALMGIPSIWIFSHDSVGLGEDGPTHQPIEQLAMVRATPDLIDIRPADANETWQAVRLAVTRSGGPVALITSRQKLPVLDPNAVPEDAVERGAYVLLDPPGGEIDVILIATGSEVSLCLEAAGVLSERGVSARVVSMPSMRLFERQPVAYRDAVLLPAVGARLSVEMASPYGWSRWVGDRGASFGIDRFGASAPIGDICRHFGFTPEGVADFAQGVVAGEISGPVGPASVVGEGVR